MHQASTGVDMLKVVKVSKAQALQRTGRAGREAEGHCYRILTKSEFNALPEDGVPEIKRCNLAGVVLQMLAVGVRDVRRFDFMDRPPDDAVDGAMRMLRLLGAISFSAPISNQSEQLTDLGKRMAAFPLDPRFTKVLFCAKELGCTYVHSLNPSFFNILYPQNSCNF